MSISDVRPRLWTRGFTLATSITFFTSLVFYLLMTSMALYAIDRFQSSDSTAGLAASIYILGSLFARLLVGGILKYLGHRNVLMLCLGSQVAASLLYLPASSFEFLIFLRFVHGMAFGAGSTALASVAQALIPESRRSEGTNHFYLSTTLSTAVGPFLAVLLTNATGYDGIFYVCTAFSCLGFLIALLARSMYTISPQPVNGVTAAVSGPQRPAHRIGSRRPWLERFIEPSVLKIVILALPAGIAYSGVITFLAAYTRNEDNEFLASLFFFVYAGAVFAARLVFGSVQDRHGDNAALYPTFAGMTLGLALLALPPSTLSVVGAASLIGFGYGTLGSSIQVIAIRMVSDSRMSMSITTFYIMLDAGAGFGPVLLGLVIPLSGFSGMYVILSALVMATTVAYYFVHGHQSPAIRRMP